MDKGNWTYKQFEDCIEKVKHTTKLQTSDYQSYGEYPIISQEDEMISGYWDKKEDVFNVIKPIVVFGDHTRVLKYVDFDFVLGADGVKILQPIDALNAKFLFYYLKWSNIPSLGYSRHYKLLKEISVPVPPLPIQQRIVAELDCISSILEKKRQQLKELDNLAQAIFYDMFGDPVENEKGWEVNSLNRIALLKNGLNFERVDEGIKVKILGVSDFQENKKISSKEIGYTIVSKEVEDNFYLKDNDLVFVRSNGSKSLIGRCVLINTFGEKVSFSGFCIRCRIISDKVIPQFLLSLMQEPKVKVQLTCGGRGCNIQNINQENLGKQPVILPPLSLQQSFAAKIEAIEKQKERISQSIKEVQTLFDSQMEVYFG